MVINRENIEAYMLDLYEGRLSSEEEKVLRSYLLLHPEFEVLLPEDSLPVLEAGSISYEGKGTLRKEFPSAHTSINRENFDMACIAGMEGDLSPDQDKILEKLCAEDPELEREWLDWQKTHLWSSPVLYPLKKQLKKRAGLVRPLGWTAALAAASLALFLLLGRYGPLEDMDPPELSMDESPRVIEEVPASEEEETMETPVPVQPLMKAAAEEVHTSETHILAAVQVQADAAIPVETPVSVKTPVIEKARLALLQKVRPLQGVHDRIDPIQLAVLSTGDKTMLEPWADRGLKQSYRRFIKENDLSLVSVASAGVEGINALTGSDMEMNVRRDEKGEAKSVSFRSFFLSVDAPIKRLQ